MIDNFEQISKLLKFEDESDFYFIQVLQRNKENPELGSNNRLVKGYYIDSLQKLEKYKEEMIKLAQVFNARVYIHLNRRNFRMLAFELLEDICHQMKSNQYQTIHHSYDSVCGKHHSDKDKTWIIDIDGEELKETNIPELIKTINSFIEPFNNRDKIITTIPTKNGIHLISTPFNSQRFSELYPKIVLHKNNPTILYHNIKD